MRTFLSCLLILLSSFALVADEAWAKRFGGGRSFGVQRSKSSLYSPQQATRSARAPVQPANSGKWKGFLGGALLGGLLASLFMGHGLGAGLLSWLVLGALIFLLVSFLRRRMQPGYQSVQSAPLGQTPFNRAADFSQSFGAGSASASPEEFAPEPFLRDAKVKFLRLQTAWDQKNLKDIQEFTAPEVYAEIRMQLEEQGEEADVTEVSNLDAQLLDFSKQADALIASVRFTGLIRENGVDSQLDEIWHFRKFYNSNDWVVGGIQQDVFEPE